MGLFTVLATLPLAPLRVVIRLGELIQEEADRQLANPAAIQRALEEIEAARDAGEISEAEYDQAVRRVLRRVSPG